MQVSPETDFLGPLKLSLQGGLQASDKEWCRKIAMCHVGFLSLQTMAGGAGAEDCVSYCNTTLFACM